ncbi:MAG: glycosyltransferase [Lentisphaeria bacterium]|nr:glycosyltransferase [Lentisphaeria bacterium]
MIKVSVCIPIYGVEKYIERCARSLFEQTMLDGIEFIFVNDCTKDRSIEILERVLTEYPQRQAQTRIIHHKTNGGLVAARKTGLRHAQGDYIAHCDSDDWVEKNMYEVMYKKAISSNADMVYCDYCTDLGAKKIIHKLKSISQPDKFLFYLTSDQEYMSVWAKIYKRSIYQAVLPKLDNALCMNEDFICNFYALQHCKTISHIPIPLYHYFLNISSMSKVWKREYVENLLQIHYIVASQVQEGKCPQRCQWAYEQFILFAFLRHPEIIGKREFSLYRKKFFRSMFIWAPMTLVRRIYLIMGFLFYPLVRLMLKCEKILRQHK